MSSHGWEHDMLSALLTELKHKGPLLLRYFSQCIIYISCIRVLTFSSVKYMNVRISPSKEYSLISSLVSLGD